MPIPDALRELSYDGDMMREGREGEAEVYEMLRRMPAVLRVDDVRDDVAWRARDVDFLVHRMVVPMQQIEVKSDRYIAKTGNFCFELARIHHTGEFFRAGWSVFSEATHVYVWSAEPRCIYAMRMSVIRSAFRQFVRGNRQAQLALVQTDNQRTTLNVLLPLSYIPHDVYVRAFDKWVLKRD